MPPACFIYLFEHQNINRPFSFFDIGKSKTYFDTVRMEEMCYKKINAFITYLKKNDHPKLTCYFSGIYLELLRENKPYFQLIRKKIDTGQIELLGGTWSYSFSSLLSDFLFEKEIIRHLKEIENIFEYHPAGFVNTNLISSENIWKQIKKYNFQYAVVPKIAWFQGKFDTSNVFLSKKTHFPLLLASVESVNEKHTNCFLTKNTVQKNIVKSQTGYEMICEATFRPNYYLPNIVAVDINGHNLSYYFNHVFQKQVLKRCQKISKLLSKDHDENLINDLLKICSPSLFKQIGFHSEYTSRNNHYIQIMNIMTDMELSLLETQ